MLPVVGVIILVLIGIGFVYAIRVAYRSLSPTRPLFLYPLFFSLVLTSGCVIWECTIFFVFEPFEQALLFYVSIISLAAALVGFLVFWSGLYVVRFVIQRIRGTPARITSVVPLALAMVSLILAGYLVYIRATRLGPLPPHHGDGTFKDISWRFSPDGLLSFPLYGYEIVFPTFNLGDKYETEFKMTDLPDIGKDVVVYLCVADPEHRYRSDAARDRLIARVQFDISDEYGKLVCHVAKPLAKMYWADPEGGADCYGLYSLPESVFVSRKGTQYRLHVRYLPDPQLACFRGFVYIRCGGSI
jgi:hypothetical protein